MNAQEIRDLFKRHDVPLSRDDVWDVRGNPVIKHRAMEALAMKVGIIWDKPVIIRAERDEAVVLVSGCLEEGGGKRSGVMEWSIGEAAIGQSYQVSGKQAAFPYAMAEKRGKDRVILKLAGLTGVYSEEEMRQQGPDESEPEERQAPPPTEDSRSVYVKKSLALIEQIQTPEAVSAWLDTEVEKGVWKQYGISEHHDDGKAILMACKKRRLELKQKEAA
jgi:hypothetical protein